MKRDPGIDVWTIWIYLILWTVQLNVVKTVIALLCVIYHTHKNPTTSSLPMGLSAVYTLCRTQRSCCGKTTHIFRQPSGLETWKRVCVYTCLAIVAGVVLNPVTYCAVPLLPSTVVTFQRCRKRRQSSALEPRTQEAERNEGQAFSFVSTVSFYLYLITPESQDQPSFSLAE